MGKSKTFSELSKSIEVLNENAQGQLRGGFAVFSSNELITDLEDSNSSCTNNCRCKNKNRRNCQGCSNTSIDRP
ncbi:MULTISPECIES: hypothetical protein [unclassified Myroides]|uniref:hypothetical protein n=1 Tax=unclassified Myroides TaxID=2642485 RepID=UPI003D2F99CD